MAARDRAASRGRVRRVLLRPLPVVVSLLGLASACLNPHPDEQPTFNDSREPGDHGIDVAPPAETCADNPLLAGCAQTVGGAPAATPGAGGANAGNDSTGAAGSATAGSAGDAGAGDAAERDAGPVDALQGAADAG